MTRLLLAAVAWLPAVLADAHDARNKVTATAAVIARACRSTRDIHIVTPAPIRFPTRFSMTLRSPPREQVSSASSTAR